MRRRRAAFGSVDVAERYDRVAEPWVVLPRAASAELTSAPSRTIRDTT
jgi:hypothetical protein